jgi:hypothetical protein
MRTTKQSNDLIREPREPEQAQSLGGVGLVSAGEEDEGGVNM